MILTIHGRIARLLHDPAVNSRSDCRPQVICYRRKNCL